MWVGDIDAGLVDMQAYVMKFSGLLLLRIWSLRIWIVRILYHLAYFHARLIKYVIVLCGPVWEKILEIMSMRRMKTNHELEIVIIS